MPPVTRDNNLAGKYAFIAFGHLEVENIFDTLFGYKPAYDETYLALKAAKAKLGPFQVIWFQLDDHDKPVRCTWFSHTRADPRQRQLPYGISCGWHCTLFLTGDADPADVLGAYRLEEGAFLDVSGVQWAREKKFDISPEVYYANPAG